MDVKSIKSYKSRAATVPPPPSPTPAPWNPISILCHWSILEMHGLSCGMYYFMDFSVGFLHVFDLFLNFSTLLFKISQIILMASQGWQQLVLQPSELTRILCLMVFHIAIMIAVHVHWADQVHLSQCACLTLPQPYPNMTKRNLKINKFRLIWGTQGWDLTLGLSDSQLYVLTVTPASRALYFHLRTQKIWV